MISKLKIFVIIGKVLENKIKKDAGSFCFVLPPSLHDQPGQKDPGQALQQEEEKTGDAELPDELLLLFGE